MADELDEFGIPIRKKKVEAKTQVSADVDEFGIPIKKKIALEPSKTSSQTSYTTSGTNREGYEEFKSSLPKRLQYEGDYDLRGYYNKYGNRGESENGHLTDEFKLPNHPTFSTESKYFNEQTKLKGGEWEGNKYIPFDPNRNIFDEENNTYLPNDRRGNTIYQDSFIQPFVGSDQTIPATQLEEVQVTASKLPQYTLSPERLAQIDAAYGGDRRQLDIARKAESGDSGTITTYKPDEAPIANRAKYLYNKLLQGVGSVASGLGDVALQGASVMSTGTTGTGSVPLKLYREKIAPDVRSYLKDTIGSEKGKEREGQYNRETFTGALGGLAQSVPAMAATAISGGVGGGAMFLQSYDNALESIDQSEAGRNLDDVTKTIFATTVGTVTSALEKYGFDKIFKGETGVISNLIAQRALKNASKETGEKVTGDVLSKFLDKELVSLSNKFVKGGAKALDGAIIEYGTEAAQEGAQAGAEILTNKLTGKPVFDISETSKWDGFLSRMNKAGIAGAIGGGLLGGVAGIANLSKGDVVKQEQQITDIDNALSNESLSDASREVLVQRKIDLQNKLQETAGKIDDAYDKLDDKQKDEVNGIVEQKVKLQEAIADPALSEEVKKSLEQQSEGLDKQLSEIKPVEGAKSTETTETSTKEKEVGTEPKNDEKIKEVKSAESTNQEAAPKAEEAVAETRKETVKEPLNKEEPENAVKEIKQQESVSGKREEGDQSREATEASSSDSIQREETGKQEKVESPTALKNEDIANKRKELGLEPREQVERKSNTELVEKAKAKIKEGYDVESLIDEVVINKKALSDEEGVMLKQYQLAKENRLVEIGDEIIKATEEGKGTALDKLIEERASLVNDIDRSFRAGEQSGTISARALQARKAAMLNDYSLANMLIQKRKAAGDGKLTPEQIEQTSKEYKRIKKLNEEFEVKVAKLEAENAKLKADKAFKGLKEFTKRESNRLRTKEQIDADINDTVGSLKKKLKEQRGKLSANAIPVDIIPEIAKLAKLYTQKGLVNLSSVVDKIYTELKDDIDNLKKEDIEELIANYDYEGEAANQRRLEAFKKRTGKRIEELRSRLESKDFSSKRKLPEIKLDKEGQELQDELRKAKYEWDKGLEQDALARRTTLEKIRDGVTEVLNLPRALMATLDYSAPLRQGLVLTISRPDVARKAFIEMFKQSASQKQFDRYLANLKESPQFPVMEKAGLYIADPHTPKLAAKEEQFMSNLAEKIPLIGKGFEFKVGDKNIKIGGLNLIGGAERAYTAYLNKLRADVFTQGADLFERDGKTIETDPKLYEALADYVNSATGRGNLGKLENSAQVLNSMFFSPRLIASRIRLLTNWANPVWYANTPWAIKKMYIQDMGKTIAFGATILALASLAGADVEKDPRSSDFGKIRLGDTRWDIWGGFQQFVRFFTQIVSGQRKNTRDKTVRDIDGKGFKGETRADVALNMLRSKLSPVPATAWNLASGKTMVGEEYGLKDVPPSFLPLFVTDLVKAVNRGGADAIITQGLPGVFGVGVQTYGDKNKDNVDFLKMSKSEQKKFIDDAVKKAKESMDKK